MILIKHMIAYHHAVCLKFLKGNLREKPQELLLFFFRLSFEAEEIGDPINTAYLDRSDRHWENEINHMVPKTIVLDQSAQQRQGQCYNPFLSPFNRHSFFYVCRSLTTFANVLFFCVSYGRSSATEFNYFFPTENVLILGRVCHTLEDNDTLKSRKSLWECKNC